MKEDTCMDPRISEFAGILTEQVETLEMIANCERLMQAALLVKDWPSLDTLIRETASCTGEVEALEKKRHRMYRQLIGSDESPGGLAGFLETLPETERKTLSDLYRRLRIAVMNIQSVTTGIDAYVEAAGTTTREVLEEIFPERRGRIYSRSGASSAGKGTALVLDHQL
jgi:hypothetical protein